MNYVDDAAVAGSETVTPNRDTDYVEEEMVNGYKSGVDDAEVESVKEKPKYRDAESAVGERVSGMKSSACDAEERESVMGTPSRSACGEELVSGMEGGGAENESGSENEKVSASEKHGLNRMSTTTHFPSLTRFPARVTVAVLERCS